MFALSRRLDLDDAVLQYVYFVDVFVVARRFQIYEE